MESDKPRMMVHENTLLKAQVEKKQNILHQKQILHQQETISRLEKDVHFFREQTEIVIDS